MNNILSCNNVRLSLTIWYTLSMRTPSNRFQSTSLFDYHSLSCRYLCSSVWYSNPPVSVIISRPWNRGQTAVAIQAFFAMPQGNNSGNVILTFAAQFVWDGDPTEHRWYIYERSMKMRWKSWYFGPLANKFCVGRLKVEKKWRMVKRYMRVEHRKFALCETSVWVDLGMTT